MLSMFFGQGAKRSALALKTAAAKKMQPAAAWVASDRIISA